MENEENKCNEQPKRWGLVLLQILSVVLLVVAGILVTSLFRGCEEWRRMGCATDLKQLGILCHIYAERNGGAFPSRWSDLATIEYATNAQFYCPSTRHAPGGWESVDLWTDYRLMPNLRANAAPDTVLAIEPLANHHGEGANVLFADGRVQWRTASQIESWQNKMKNPEPPVGGDGKPAPQP